MSFVYNYSQELEPRAITNLPVGTNFLVAGYGFTQGDVVLDPALPIEDLNGTINGTVLAYIRSIDFFGLSAKIDIIQPLVFSEWDGEFQGDDSFATRNGLGDTRFRFSFNFLNSPAMKPAEFAKYHRDVVSGISLQIVAPTGNYSSERLINLGSNRWTIKPQWGYSKSYNKWIYEFYTSIWFFTKNNNYVGGNELKQNPLYTAKIHVIRKLPKNMWISANLGYGVGGKTFVNGEARISHISAARFGLNFSVPFNSKHSFNLGIVSGIRFEKGSDNDAFSISYQYRWNKSVKKYLLNQKNKTK